jgi:hypothetical protein
MRRRPTPKPPRRALAVETLEAREAPTGLAAADARPAFTPPLR